MTAAREKLPNRRASFSFNFNCGAHQYTAPKPAPQSAGDADDFSDEIPF
jgi:hypothetical protein